MQRLAAHLCQGVAEWLTDHTERDAIHDRPVAGLESQPKVRLPDLVGMDQLVRWQRYNRLGIARAERPGTIERCHELGRCRAGADCAIDEELADMA